MLNLTSSQLRQAADLKDKIEALQTELEQITGTSEAAAPVAAAPTVALKKRGRPRRVVAAVVIQEPSQAPKRGPKKGGMSAAGRAAIAAAQRARWAKAKAGKVATVAAKTAEAKPAKKRTMSAAGRAAIAAAAKARWAKFRKAKKA